MRQIFLVQDAHHLAFLQMLVIPHDMVTAKKMGRGNPNKTPTHFQMSAGAINAPSVESATHINDLSDSIDSSVLHFSFIYSFINNAPRGLWDLSSLTRDWTHATAVNALRPNHWTARKFLWTHFLISICLQSARCLLCPISSSQPYHPESVSEICVWKTHFLIRASCPTYSVFLFPVTLLFGQTGTPRPWLLVPFLASLPSPPTLVSHF